MLASSNPAAMIYDPAFAYEVAIVVEDAISRMFGPAPEDRFWYLTLYNENYPMPSLPEGSKGEAVRQGVIDGLYRFAGKADGGDRRASIVFSGPMWQAAMEARTRLAEDWGVSADAWSATSWTGLRSEALSVERWNRLHPRDQERTPFVTERLGESRDPVIAVTDYLRAVPDQVARWVRRPFTSLGTDGFGRSDARQALRHYFEVDAGHIVVATLSALARQGRGDPAEVAKAIDRFGIDPEAAEPFDAR
jgi:pyruvate dehydrogenase E1 component